MRPDDTIPPRPIPVSERLPKPYDPMLFGLQDSNEHGEVWIEEPGYQYSVADTGDYDWQPHVWMLREIEPRDTRWDRRWLPHWALPLPEVE